MDPVLALALLSLGAFVCVVATGLVYIWAVRPRLLKEEHNQFSTLEQLKQHDILLRELRSRLRTPPPRPPVPPTRLADIKGIGPVYEKVLHEAGINTFEKLAALTPRQLQEIINAPDWRTIDAESWLEQARLFDEWLKDAEEEA